MSEPRQATVDELLDALATAHSDYGHDLPGDINCEFILFPGHAGGTLQIWFKRTRKPYGSETDLASTIATFRLVGIGKYEETVKDA